MHLFFLLNISLVSRTSREKYVLDLCQILMDLCFQGKKNLFFKNHEVNKNLLFGVYHSSDWKAQPPA